MNDLARGVLTPAGEPKPAKDPQAAPRASKFGENAHTETFRGTFEGGAPAKAERGRFAHGGAFDEYAQDQRNGRFRPRNKSLFDGTDKSRKPNTQFGEVYAQAASPAAELEQLTAQYTKLEASAGFNLAAPEVQKLLGRMQVLTDQVEAEDDEEEAEE